jgi:hypothetical protein
MVCVDTYIGPKLQTYICMDDENTKTATVGNCQTI